MRYILTALILLFSFNNHATTNCGTLSIQEFYVEADRPSDPKYSNLLLIRLSNANGEPVNCANKAYAYIEYSAEAFDPIYSLFLLIYSQKGNYGLVADENTTIGEAVRIEYIFPQ